MHYVEVLLRNDDGSVRVFPVTVERARVDLEKVRVVAAHGAVEAVREGDFLFNLLGGLGELGGHCRERGWEE